MSVEEDTFEAGVEDSRTMAINAPDTTVPRTAASPTNDDDSHQSLIPSKRPRATTEDIIVITDSESDVELNNRTTNGAGTHNSTGSNISRPPRDPPIELHEQARKRLKVESDSGSDREDLRDEEDAEGASIVPDDSDDAESDASGSDEYEVDIRGRSSEPIGSKDIAGRESASRHQQSAVQNPLADIDSTTPIEEVKQKIPTIAQVQGQFSEKIKKNNAVRENKQYVINFVTAIHTYRKAVNCEQRFRTKGEGDGQQVTERLREAEVRMAWVKYFPLGRPWIAPYGLKGNKKLKPKDDVYLLQQTFFSIVDRCLRNGSLQDLRQGKFGGPRECLKKFDDETIARQEEYESLTRRLQSTQGQLAAPGKTNKKRKKSTGHLRSRLQILSVDMNYCDKYPKNLRYARIRDFKKFGAAINAQNAPDGSPARLWNLVEWCMKNRRLHEFREGRLPELEPFIKTLGSESLATNSRQLFGKDMPEELIAQTNPSADGTASNSGSELAQKSKELMSESDDAVTRTYHPVAKSDMESGEITSASEARSPLPSVPARSTREINDVKRTSSVPQTEGSADHAESNGQRKQILRDLSPQDLDAQIRYFHFTKPRDAVDLEAVVRCLCCGQKGHMAVDCEQLICCKCGAYNLHPATHCDLEVKCNNCGNLGHSVSECSKKQQGNMVCRLCSQKGHDEHECELFWRSSGAPWEIDLPFGELRLSCYECGGHGHLGNDCSSRRPGKPPGTSTWTVERKMPPPQKYDPDDKKDGLNIRDHATRPTNPLPQRAKKGEQTGFTRPKGPEPTKKGNINISSNVAGTSTIQKSKPNGDNYWDNPEFPKWTPLNQPSALGKEISIKGQANNSKRPGPPAPKEKPPPPPREPPPRPPPWQQANTVQYPSLRYPQDFPPSVPYGAVDSYRPQQDSYRPAPPPPPSFGVDHWHQTYQLPQAYQHPPSYQQQGSGQMGGHNASRQTDSYRPMPSAAKNAWGQQWR